MVENKVIFITGAASGIGYKIAEDFAKSGALPILTDINEDKVKEASEELIKNGYECIGMKCDVTNEEKLHQVIDKTVERYGRLDVLINNAGVQHVSSLEEFPTEKFEFIVKVMLVGPFMA